MSSKSGKRKSKYESPVLVPLGALAKGSGVCGAGSAVAGGVPWGDIGTCTVGPRVVAGIVDCAPGFTASNSCTEGTTANLDCTAGTDALRDCTAGTAATGTTCSAGGFV